MGILEKYERKTNSLDVVAVLFKMHISNSRVVFRVHDFYLMVMLVML